MCIRDRLERGAQSFGIFAPFYFLSRSKGHICDLTLSAEPDDGFFEGSLSVRAFGEFIDGGKCTLYDTKGERVSAADFSEEGTACLLYTSRSEAARCPPEGGSC